MKNHYVDMLPANRYLFYLFIFIYIFELHGEEINAEMIITTLHLHNIVFSIYYTVSYL